MVAAILSAQPQPISGVAVVPRSGRLSPDQRWLAYSSDETDRPEVYVRPFPALDAKWQVSTGGGSEPTWRGDGRERFYLSSDSKLMAVDVATAAGFSASVPRLLFGVHVLTYAQGNAYVASRDGQRFLVNTVTEDDAPRPIVVIVNWLGGVKLQRA